MIRRQTLHQVNANAVPFYVFLWSALPPSEVRDRPRSP
jgi:hypothetical protein